MRRHPVKTRPWTAFRYCRARLRRISRLLVLPVGMAISSGLYADCWTVKAEGGVIAKSNATAAINTGQVAPLKPNPKDAQWRCRYNNVWFHRNEKGEAFDDKAVDRMLSVALSAFKSDSYIRVCLKQDSNNDCYTYQMFDIGRDP